MTQSELTALTKEVTACKQCKLRNSCANVVPGRGVSSPDLMIVTLFPNRTENKNQQPGMSIPNQFLGSHLRKMGFNPGNIYWTNVVKCTPSRGNPAAYSIYACRDNLENEIAVVNPKVILAVGGEVMKWFKIKGGIRKNHAKLFDTELGKVIPCVSPAALGKSPRDISIVANIGRAINTFLAGGKTPPKNTLSYSFTDVAGVDVEVENWWEKAPTAPYLWSVGISGGGDRYATEVLRCGPPGVRKMLNGVTPVFHNAPYDVPWIEGYTGTRLEKWHDTQHEAHILGYAPLDLKTLMAIQLGGDHSTFHEIAGTAAKPIPYDSHPEEMLDYNSKDSWGTVTIHHQFQKEIKRRKLQPLLDKAHEVSRVLIDMRERGMPVSQERLVWLRKEMLRDMVPAQRIIQAAGIEPDDQNGMRKLFWAGKTKVVTSPKSGQLSLKGKVLYDNAEPDQIELVSAWIKYHSNDKFISTYVDNWRHKEWLHPWLNQTGTATWRFSSSKPNLQNVPKNAGAKLYQVFVAPEGYTFISLDYSQVELRLLANLVAMHTRDTSLRDLYLRGEDMHDNTSKLEAIQVTAKLLGMKPRDVSKRFNFGVIYGISERGLESQFGIPEAQGIQILDQFANAHPGVKEFLGQNIAHAERHGYIEGFDGMPLYIPALASTWGGLRSHGENQAANYPIQYGAARIAQDAMVRCPQYCVMQVHDELLYLVPDGEVEEYGEHLKKELVDYRHDVTYTTDFHTGKTWGDIKKIPEIASQAI